MSLLAVILAVGAATPQWAELTPALGAAPTPRANASAIHDPVGHRMIVFGGRTQAGDVNDVWAFDLATGSWTEITPASGPMPAARFTQNAVYDHAGRQMIIWSGQATAVFENDVWAFDLDAHEWGEFLPPEPIPAMRYGTAAVFDPVTRDLVTFAGFTNLGRFDDTWRFDVEGVAWTDVTPAVNPAARCLHSASYEAAGHRMIMYGGTNNSALGDIWAFDLSADLWTELTPADPPPGRYFSAHSYDARRRRALIFGGNLQPGYTNEMMAFDLDSEQFETLSPTGTAPSAREGATSIYVVTEDRFVLFGGNDGSRLNDVWALELAPGEALAFPWPILADGDAFGWEAPASVQFVRGALDAIAGYAVDTIDSAVHATSFTDASVPLAGEGYYYLVRLDGDAASWQTAPGAEADRDVLLP